MTGLELVALRLIAPFYGACKSAYNGIKLTAAFGRDYTKAKRELETQYTRLELTGTTLLEDLELPIDPDDGSHNRTRVVLNVLADMKDTFEKCEKLVKGAPRHTDPLKPAR